MTKHDLLFVNWIKQNAAAIRNHLKTAINPEADWDNLNLTDEITSYSGWPSEWEDEPYLEDLVHVLDNGKDQFGLPIPDELIAYRLSKWAGSEVPVNHSLVQNAEHWCSVLLDMEYDNAERTEVIKFIRLLRGIAKNETAENLPKLENITGHFDSPTIDGKLYVFHTDLSVIHLLVGDEQLAAMNDEGKIVILDYDGNRQHGDPSRIRNYIVGGMKLLKPLTERGELASLVGNDIADMLLGANGISIFDLPD